eukprot:1520402-Prymnesium_polylepis.1
MPERKSAVPPDRRHRTKHAIYMHARRIICGDLRSLMSALALELGGPEWAGRARGDALRPSRGFESVAAAHALWVGARPLGARARVELAPLVGARLLDRLDAALFTVAAAAGCRVVHSSEQLLPRHRLRPLLCSTVASAADAAPPPPPPLPPLPPLPPPPAPPPSAFAPAVGVAAAPSARELEGCRLKNWCRPEACGGFGGGAVERSIALAAAGGADGADGAPQHSGADGPPRAAAVASGAGAAAAGVVAAGAAVAVAGAAGVEVEVEAEVEAGVEAEVEAGVEAEVEAGAAAGTASRRKQSREAWPPRRARLESGSGGGGTLGSAMPLRRRRSGRWSEPCDEPARRCGCGGAGVDEDEEVRVRRCGCGIGRSCRCEVSCRREVRGTSGAPAAGRRCHNRRAP